ncbi:type II toxin-antitoxin system RelE/ParE family toxin [Peteryoungia ipomoeae]|uniref:Type II toxin-antitoxin system RelE/ParE family toxin n=1 Tax=Peteryoungia ipomoeae TaxID=1210932 RepID=A0A4S8NZD6_9HYPH|nr:type II toxin-antitoxin system RelE/ParE family toxin [Peteryoungia ipomoeae]THV23107.1 type II toxin-antitoxin system RelE/ParE family toxin [Peteryoungia ipomoeae]
MGQGSRTFTLAPRAIRDLEEIWAYGADTWSVAQADTYLDGLNQVFEVIAGSPLLFRLQSEFDPPVRVHVYQSHLVIFVCDDQHVTIVRVLGGRQNWQALLHALD